MEFETVIGLEVHVELATNSKIFCSCSTTYGAPPNSQICPVCMGLPGVLPVFNKKVLGLAIMAAIALNCEIHTSCRFDRKNYFYPDLPKNYQISQYAQPLATSGYLELPADGKRERVSIKRVHMEEDTGKLLHQEDGHYSFVDFNRTGVPLLEIVSEPVLKSPKEAYDYLLALKSILQYLEVSDCNMEEGSLRCDANISLRPAGSLELGSKAEVKNLNSFKAVMKAMEYEALRQRKLISSGQRVLLETRLWDEEEGLTHPMRSKEEVHDYRYFPEPDLIPLHINEAFIEEIRGKLPELPQARKERFMRQYGLPEYDSEVLTSARDLADYFERCLLWAKDSKTVSNWVMTELMRLLKENNLEARACPISPEKLTGLLQLVEEGNISGKMAKDIFKEMFQSGLSAQEIIKARDLSLIKDEASLRRAIEKVISQHPDAVAAIKGGKEKTLGFLMGQVMKATKGQGEPRLIQQLLKEIILGQQKGS